MKRILIVRTDRIGDVVAITAIPREIKKTFPDAFIATLTQPGPAEILLNNPNIDQIITDDLEKNTFWKVVREIRKGKFTHGLLVKPTERAAWQMFFAGIPVRVGVGHIFYEVITGMRSVNRNKYIPLRHEADYCMDTARKIGVKGDDIKPELFLIPEERAGGSLMLIRRNVYVYHYTIMLHTGSKGSAPNWSETKYLRLIQRILDEFKSRQLRILLTAKEMTRDFIDKAIDIGKGRVLNISYEIGGIRSYMEVISTADVFIASSTGPLHLAGALGISCIGLHCHRPMNCAQYWGILNDKSFNLEVPAYYCDENCSADKKICGFEDGISVKEVIDSIHAAKRLKEESGI